MVREESKGSWEPSQRVQVLGLIVDTVKMTVEIQEEKVKELKKLSATMLKSTEPPVRVVAAVAGKVISVSRAFPFARMVTRSLFE